MYENFSDRARRIIQLARQEAQRYNHEYVGTEMLLLGLMQEETGVAIHVLHELGLNPDRIHQEVDKIIFPNPEMFVGQLPLTPRTRKCLELAAEVARELRDPVVDSEHLLLGMIYEPESVAGQILRNLGLTPTTVYPMLLKLREQSRNG